MTDAPDGSPRPGLLPIFGEKPTDPFVVICTPTITKPYPQYLDALEASLPLLEAAGIRHASVNTVGSPYISCARAEMLRKALDAKADIIVFIDHDLSWDPEDLRILIETEGDVVAGTYRFKIDEESYMGTIKVNHITTKPLLRESDGAIRANLMPAGFLKVTKEAVHRFMEAYPELCFGPKFNPSVDLFNHGAHDGQWWGEDYAFCRRWNALGGEVWLVPNLNLTHHSADQAFPGNFLDYSMRRPGGAREGLKPWWVEQSLKSAA